MTAPPCESAAVLGIELQKAIVAGGRAQVTVADDLGISPKHLSGMLTGKAGLSLAWAERIAAACGHRIVVKVVRAPRQGPKRRRAGWNTTEPTDRETS